MTKLQNFSQLGEGNIKAYKRINVFSIWGIDLPL